MRVRFWMKGFVIVPALCLVGLSAAAQQTGDPVADAARKAREAKKDTTKPKKVYTDDDVKRSAPEPVPAPAAAPVDASGTAAATAVQAAGGAAKTGDGAKTGDRAKTGDGAKSGDGAKPGDAAKTGEPTKTEDPNGQAAWRRRFQVQRDKITKAEKELEILGRELEKAQMEYYPDPQKAMKQQNSRADINAINAKIDAKKKEVAQLQQGLDDMEEQLRKSGGDPGWAR